MIGGNRLLSGLRAMKGVESEIGWFENLFAFGSVFGDICKFRVGFKA